MLSLGMRLPRKSQDKTKTLHACVGVFCAVFKISEISTDISAIFRVSVNTDTIYPSDNRPTEISEFFCSYRRHFADISVFY